eukprot:4068015-Prymnesium_polylepis.1
MWGWCWEVVGWWGGEHVVCEASTRRRAPSIHTLLGHLPSACTPVARGLRCEVRVPFVPLSHPPSVPLTIFTPVSREGGCRFVRLVRLVGVPVRACPCWSVLPRGLHCRCEVNE